MAGLRNLIKTIVFLTLLSFFIGCNSTSGVVEPVGVGKSGVTGFLSVSDEGGGGGNGTKTIDVVQGICTLDDPNTADDETKFEPFYDALATVTFSSGKYAPNIEIREYSVEYIPLPSPDGSGGTYMPPVLLSIRQYTEITIPNNGTASSSVIAMDVATKSEFVTLTTGGQALYTIRIKFRGEDEWGDSFSITLNADVLLANYDNC